MKVLFIARTYPPTVGGMQKFASDFYNNFKTLGSIDLFANRGGNVMMPLFLVKLTLFLLFNARQYAVIHFSDAMLAPLIPLIRTFSRAKISFTVHGLDIVYSRFGYQRIVIPFLKQADKIFSVSDFTKEQCLQRGVLSEKIIKAPNCINFDSTKSISPSEIAATLSKFKIDTKNKRILLTVGRLIKRKGHAWFLANVFLKLPSNHIYLVAGLGPEYEALDKIIKKLALSKRVYLLGHVSEAEKEYLYQISDLFIMPNIRIPGDQEGFGIVLLEAGQSGLPIIASNLEGIKDAVLDGKTGRLVEAGDVTGFLNAINDHRLETSNIKDIVLNTFDCSRIITRYFLEFQKMCAIPEKAHD